MKTCLWQLVLCQTHHEIAVAAGKSCPDPLTETELGRHFAKKMINWNIPLFGVLNSVLYPLFDSGLKAVIIATESWCLDHKTHDDHMVQSSDFKTSNPNASIHYTADSNNNNNSVCFNWDGKTCSYEKRSQKACIINTLQDRIHAQTIVLVRLIVNAAAITIAVVIAVVAAWVTVAIVRLVVIGTVDRLVVRETVDLMAEASVVTFKIPTIPTNVFIIQVVVKLLGILSDSSIVAVLQVVLVAQKDSLGNVRHLLSKTILIIDGLRVANQKHVRCRSQILFPRIRHCKSLYFKVIH
jgi:hypothetical protein